MSAILNITNGDAAVAIMRSTNVPGVFLPWQDVLHEGPVPDGLSLEALSEVRARFIIERGWGEPADVTRAFAQRDRTLGSAASYDKVILWFEHDLYDQLQLLQILDWFNASGMRGTPLTMICVDRYLGTLSPEAMSALFQYEQPVSEDQLVLASRAWSAFRSSTPDSWRALLGTDLTALPFLEGAIIRLLQEYPACSNGLSRSAEQALKIVAAGVTRPGRVFARYQETEERRFMGDLSFWTILQQFLDASPPLLTRPEDKASGLSFGSDLELAMAPAGEAVLSGERSWLDIVRLDRWIGGVHLTPENAWCREPVSGELVKR